MQELYDRIKNVANNILESNLSLIFADLDKSMKDRIDEGFETACIKPQISINIQKQSDTHYLITPSIKWERKVTKADSLDSIDIDLAQPELFDAEVMTPENKESDEIRAIPAAPRQLNAAEDEETEVEAVEVG